MYDKSINKPYEDKMKKTISSLNDELKSMRAGRANPAVLDRIQIDYYGVATPITQVGGVSVPEARTLVIQPWDTTVLQEIEKAIQKSDIGINPNNDGKVIRLNFPPLTEERRKELAKTVKKYGEESKISIRGIRRDSIENIKALKKNNVLTEDDVADGEKYVQEVTDKYVAEVDKLVDAKNEELMEV